MASVNEWCLVKHEPEIFTQLILALGSKGVQVEDLCENKNNIQIIENFKPVHGLIFLFKYAQFEPTAPIVTDERITTIYFAKQVNVNACATQALVHLLLNCCHPDLQLGDELESFKEFCMPCDPEMRGHALDYSSAIRSAHNLLAKPTFGEADPEASQDVETYHFVGYIPIDGRLYELDSLWDGPIDHGPISPQQDWLDVVNPIIMRRVDECTQREIHFSVMAVVSNRKMIYERQLEYILDNPDLLGTESDSDYGIIQNLRTLIADEEVKMAKCLIELSLRRRNYVPYIMMLLLILAKDETLFPQTEIYEDFVFKEP